VLVPLILEHLVDVGEQLRFDSLQTKSAHLYKLEFHILYMFLIHDISSFRCFSRLKGVLHPQKFAHLEPNPKKGGFAGPALGA